MRVISRNELARRTKGELTSLFAQVSKEIAYAKRGSQDWEDGMISLENIRREQAARPPRP
jgi:hypothetical protein